MSQTYSDVDASDDPRAAVEEQGRMLSWPAIGAYKSRSRQLLEEAFPVLDVGCGPGGDLVSLGVERSVGIDASQAMCAAARAKHATVVRADAHALPFASESFAGLRADRVMQHLADPTQALGEFVRLLQPRGRLVIADPDQETLVIQVPGVRQSVLDRLKALRRDVGYRNGRLISRTPQLFEQMNLDDISMEAFPLVLTDPANAFGLPRWPHGKPAEGRFSTEELMEWDHAIRGSPPGFVYVLTFLVVAGRKR
jgi:SAM-dependent methyltransferase